MSVEISNLSKKFGNLTVLNDITINIREHEMTTFLGPSGCGKTTTLRCIAGLEKPDKGEIRIGGSLVTSIASGVFVPPEKRAIGMVFQSYATWPHMNVYKNVAFPLRYRRKLSSKETEHKVKNVLKLVGLEGLENRYPAQLSGGQQQRVALARSLVYDPETLLLDEPLSNLDAKLREQMRFELKKLQQEVNVTAIYVTHDQAEAMVMSDTLVVMNRGKLVQIGRPYDMYRQPETEFVAGFMGQTNFLNGQVERIAKDRLCLIRSDPEIVAFAPTPPVVGEEVLVSLRPEDITMHRERPELAENVWRANVLDRTFTGEQFLYIVRVGESELRIRTNPKLYFEIGSSLYIHADPADCVVLTRDRD
jgi:iron(III) transport system ATP-binding protein